MKIELFGENWEPKQTIEVERKDSKESNGYRYTIHNHSSDITGYIEIRFWEIPELRTFGELVAESLLDVIGCEDEYIVEIWKFFPHGVFVTNMLPIYLQRLGVGSLSLDTVMQDLQSSEDIRNFYAKDPSRAAYKLLTSHRGFRDLEVDDPTHKYVFKRVE